MKPFLYLLACIPLVMCSFVLLLLSFIKPIKPLASFVNSKLIEILEWMTEDLGK